MLQLDIVKKLGEAVADELACYLNHPYDNWVDFGTSARGTPIHICRYFAEADLRIGVGSIVPHGAPGFSGGAKVIIPGCAGIETIAAIHQPGRLKTGLLDIQNNEFRADIEQMVTEKVGLDCIVNGVLTAQRGLAGLFVGDPIAAHRAGVSLAKQAYATAVPDEPVDIAICNAYPKDTDIHQKLHALYVLRSSPRPAVKENGTIVIVTASPEGLGYHGIFGEGMRYDDFQRQREMRRQAASFWGAPIVTYAPGLTEAEAKRDGAFRHWPDVVAHLAGRHGQEATVAVFPCGSMQVAKEAVLASRAST
jgi:nickel-dependent lactate racemase